jgi:hypothetical protein
VQQFYGYKQTLPRTEIVQEEKKNRRNYKVDVLLASTGFLKSLARNRAKKKLALVHDIYLNKSLRLFNEDLIGLISMFFLFRPTQNCIFTYYLRIIDIWQDLRSIPEQEKGGTKDQVQYMFSSLDKAISCSWCTKMEPITCEISVTFGNSGENSFAVSYTFPQTLRGYLV